MPEPGFDDALLVVEQAGTRSTLQSADIILGTAGNIAAAVHWIGTTFDRFPGCVVAGAWCEGGRWALFATRAELWTLIDASRTGLSWQSIRSLAYLVHHMAVRP